MGGPLIQGPNVSLQRQPWKTDTQVDHHVGVKIEIRFVVTAQECARSFIKPQNLVGRKEGFLPTGSIGSIIAFLTQ
jgi:hypothetical protein